MPLDVGEKLTYLTCLHKKMTFWYWKDLDLLINFVLKIQKTIYVSHTSNSHFLCRHVRDVILMPAYRVVLKDFILRGLFNVTMFLWICYLVIHVKRNITELNVSLQKSCSLRCPWMLGKSSHPLHAYKKIFFNVY